MRSRMGDDVAASRTVLKHIGGNRRVALLHRTTEFDCDTPIFSPSAETDSPCTGGI